MPILRQHGTFLLYCVWIFALVGRKSIHKDKVSLGSDQLYRLGRLGVGVGAAKLPPHPLKKYEFMSG